MHFFFLQEFSKYQNFGVRSNYNWLCNPIIPHLEYGSMNGSWFVRGNSVETELLKLGEDYFDNPARYFATKDFFTK